MHRVELKGLFTHLFKEFAPHLFLMHRVELKGDFLGAFPHIYQVFLMHRVELKGRL